MLQLHGRNMQQADPIFRPQSVPTPSTPLHRRGRAERRRRGRIYDTEDSGPTTHGAICGRKGAGGVEPAPNYRLFFGRFRPTSTPTPNTKRIRLRSRGLVIPGLVQQESCVGCCDTELSGLGLFSSESGGDYERCGNVSNRKRQNEKNETRFIADGQ